MLEIFNGDSEPLNVVVKHEMVTCIHCKMKIPIEEFVVYYGERDKREGVCRDCSLAIRMKKKMEVF